MNQRPPLLSADDDRALLTLISTTSPSTKAWASPASLAAASPSCNCAIVNLPDPSVAGLDVMSAIGVTSSAFEVVC